MARNQNMSDDERQQLVAHTITMLKAIVVANLQTGITLRRLNHEYRDNEGRWIPYRECGFNSLEDFSRCSEFQKEMAVRQDNPGELIVFPKMDQSTRHIQVLIAKQAKTKSKTKNRKPGIGLVHNNHLFSRAIRGAMNSKKSCQKPGSCRVIVPHLPVRTIKQAPKVQRDTWKPVTNHIHVPHSKYENQKQQDAGRSLLNLNQDLSHRTSFPDTMEQQMQFESMTLENLRKIGVEPVAKVGLEEGSGPFLPQEIRTNLSKLLLGYENGIAVGNLQIFYKQRFGFELDPRKFNFSSIEQMCASIPSVMKMEYLTGNKPRIYGNKEPARRVELELNNNVVLADPVKVQNHEDEPSLPSASSDNMVGGGKFGMNQLRELLENFEEIEVRDLPKEEPNSVSNKEFGVTCALFDKLADRDRKYKLLTNRRFQYAENQDNREPYQISAPVNEFKNDIPFNERIASPIGSEAGSSLSGSDVIEISTSRIIDRDLKERILKRRLRCKTGEVVTIDSSA